MTNIAFFEFFLDIYTSNDGKARLVEAQKGIEALDSQSKPPFEVLNLIDRSVLEFDHEKSQLGEL